MRYLNKRDLLLLANKLIKNTPDPRNAKECYQSFIRKTTRKLVKQSEIITYQPTTFENLSTIDIKSVIKENPKTSHKLTKIIRQAEKVGSNRFLYSDTRNS